MVFHCDSDSAHKMCDLTAVRSEAPPSSPSWLGPFVRVNDRIWDSTGTGPHPEDPFFWIRQSPRTGQLSYHIIMHNTPVGIHVFSEDGLTYTLQQSRTGGLPQPPFVYPSDIVQADGTNFTAGRRERPWLLFAPGTTQPQLLVTSMQAHVWPVVFTHAQEVRS